MAISRQAIAPRSSDLQVGHSAMNMKRDLAGLWGFVAGETLQARLYRRDFTGETLHSRPCDTSATSRNVKSAGDISHNSRQRTCSRKKAAKRATHLLKERGSKKSNALAQREAGRKRRRETEIRKDRVKKQQTKKRKKETDFLRVLL